MSHYLIEPTSDVVNLNKALRPAAKTHYVRIAQVVLPQGDGPAMIGKNVPRASYLQGHKLLL